MTGFDMNGVAEWSDATTLKRSQVTCQEKAVFGDMPG